MRTIVSKFGGSSTANAAQFARILALVRASPARRCVVLSAPGADANHREKVTSLLEECWNSRADAAALERAVSQVARRYSEIATELSMPDIATLVRREVLYAVSISLAHTLSRGEYLCALLFSRWSDIPMADAEGCIAFDEGGVLDEARTHKRLEALAAGGRRVILPGFYGANPRGRIVTFPRNGSDITGALAAAGMGAALYENWSDVPGLMTADPSIVPGARLIPQVSYRQMRALSRAGAQVLHPACLDPVAMAGIPTRLRCTQRPRCFGTLIDEHTQRDAPCVVGKREAVLPEAVEKVSRVAAFGLAEAKVRAAVEALHPLAIDVRPGRVEICIPRANYEAAVRRLHRALIEETE